jgi:hypothetical protein
MRAQSTAGMPHSKSVVLEGRLTSSRVYRCDMYPLDGAHLIFTLGGPAYLGLYICVLD